MTRRKRVAIVDDDQLQLHPLFMELELRDIDVIKISNADECSKLVDTDEEIDLFIVDVMLSAEANSEVFTRESTNNFLYTGLFLAAYIRSKRPYSPIVIFSSASDESIVKKINEVNSRIDHATYWRKYDFRSPSAFGEAVEKILEKGISESHWLLKKLWNSIVLQPNYHGVGFDVKKLFE